MFVRFAIDVLFLSEEGIVTEVRRDVHPWRVVLSHGGAAWSLLCTSETTFGTAVKDW